MNRLGARCEARSIDKQCDDVVDIQEGTCEQPWIGIEI